MLEFLFQITMLLEIWRDYREETDNNVPNTMLPEPPAARERLVQEIRFFIENIREKAKENGKYVDVFLQSMMVIQSNLAMYSSCWLIVL